MEAPTLWMKLVRCILWNVEEHWKAAWSRFVVRRGRGLGVSGLQHIVGGQFLDCEREQNGAAEDDGGVNGGGIQAGDGKEAKIIAVDKHSCSRKLKKKPMFFLWMTAHVQGNWWATTLNGTCREPEVK